MNVGLLPPAERREAEAWLSSRAEAPEWTPGVTLVARRGAGVAGILGLARLLDPNPGDGHHREHVRELVTRGDAEALPPLARAAVEAAGPRVRVEACCLDGDERVRAGLQAAGLSVEARQPQAWNADGTLRDLLWLGRPAAPLRRPPATAPAAPRRGAPAGALELAWSDARTRPALARFVAALVPGRAYPPGTLLSEAERLETQRRGALETSWLLALDGSGEVAGGLLLERDAAPQRAHVRRIHLDVAPAWRGSGAASALVRRALADASRFGALRLEADPRSGNAGAVGALRRGGLEIDGVLPGAWRVKSPARSWDEDLVLMSAACR